MVDYFNKLFKGRIGSVAYFLGSMSSWVVYRSIKIGFDILPSGIFINLVRITLLAFVVIFVFSVVVRRLHDFEKSGWWSLLAFFPIVNVILGIILVVKSGDQKKNSYGPKPRSYQYMVRDLLVLE